MPPDLFPGARTCHQSGSHFWRQAALDEFIAEHSKIIPGFGHRFHPVDPRVEPLLDLLDEAASARVVPGDLVAIGRATEAAVQRRTGKPLPMNIDGVR